LASNTDDEARTTDLRPVRGKDLETQMNQTMIQAIFWIVTLAVLVLYMQRRRKRKTN
jgi:hypothetical protein